MKSELRFGSFSGSVAWIWIAAMYLAINSGACRSAPAVGVDTRPPDPAACRQDATERSGRDPMYARLNAIRGQQGRSALFYDGDLARVAGAYAQELVEIGHLDHKGGPSERLRKKGLVRRYVAENLARFEHIAGPRDYVVKYWTSGEQELANLTSPRYIRMGFGMAASASHCYAVLILTE